MFEFELEAELLPFQYQRPAADPLFQFPPTFSTGCTQDPIFFYIPKGEGSPFESLSQRGL